MQTRSVVIYQKDTCLTGLLRIPDKTPAPAVVFHNGYGAFMNMYDAMAEAFCRAGYVTLQYENRGQYGRSSAYLRCGTEWLEDAAQAVSYIMGLPEVDRKRIGMAGLSMGGGTALILGSLDWRVKCLYAMAPVPDYKHMAEERWVNSRDQAAWDAFLHDVEEDAIRTAHGFPSRFVDSDYATRGIPADCEAREAALAWQPHTPVGLPLDSVFNVYILIILFVLQSKYNFKKSTTDNIYHRFR